MKFKAVKGLVLALGLAAAMGASAGGGGGKSFDSYQGPGIGGNNGQWGSSEWFKRVPGVPEPSEWVFLGVGLALIGVVAHRRQAKRGK